jgi:hypothetical protein
MPLKKLMPHYNTQFHKTELRVYLQEQGTGDLEKDQPAFNKPMPVNKAQPNNLRSGYMRVNQFTDTLVRHWSSATSLAPIFALLVVLETGCSSTGVGYQTGQTSPVTAGNASVERNAANRNRKVVSQTAPEAKPDRRIDTCNPAFSPATIARL